MSTDGIINYTPVKEVYFDESFNDFTDSDTGLLVIDLERFVKDALESQCSIQITRIKSLKEG